MIYTPADLIGYLAALATQHPLVAHVVTGEKSRAEEATLAKARYPQVEIETPEVTIPRAQAPTVMSCRVYVVTSVPDPKHGKEDISSDKTYSIAVDMINIIHAHAEDAEFGLSLIGNSIEVNALVANGSDSKRGWMFELALEVDFGQCESDVVSDIIDSFVLPLFSWENAETENPTGAILSFTNESLGDDVVYTWYYQEQYSQPTATVFDPDDGPVEITPLLDGDPFRIIHVWLKLVYSHKVLWAYAEIRSDRVKGRSIPFIPFYPV